MSALRPSSTYSPRRTTTSAPVKRPSRASTPPSWISPYSTSIWADKPHASKVLFYNYINPPQNVTHLPDMLHSVFHSCRASSDLYQYKPQSRSIHATTDKPFPQPRKTPARNEHTLCNTAKPFCNLAICHHDHEKQPRTTTSGRKQVSKLPAYLKNHYICRA